MCARYLHIREHYLRRPFHKAPNIWMAYLTDMNQELIDLGVRGGAGGHPGGFGSTAHAAAA